MTQSSASMLKSLRAALVLRRWQRVGAKANYRRPARILASAQDSARHALEHGLQSPPRRLSRLCALVPVPPLQHVKAPRSKLRPRRPARIVAGG